MTPDGESGEPIYAISDRAVESKKTSLLLATLCIINEQLSCFAALSFLKL